MKKKLRLPPGPRLISFAYRWFGYMRDQRRFFEGLHREFGPIVRLPANPLLARVVKRIYVVNDPALVKYYLIDNAPNYTKNFFTGQRSIVNGEAVSTSEGAFWRRHRRLVQPAFQRDWLTTLVPRMVEAVRRHLEKHWEAHASKGEPVDMLREMSRLNLAILGEIVLSQELSQELSDAIYVYFRRAIRKRKLRDLVVLSLPGPLLRAYVKWRMPLLRPAALLIDQTVRALVAQRRQDPREHEDMLARMMAAKDEHGQGLDDLEARDELVDTLYGGHVSPTAVMSWAWYSLATLPEVNARLVDEVEQVLNGRLPTAADLPRLQYTTRVMEETLRVYPPAPGVSRFALKDDQIAGYDVAAGTMVGASCFVMHNSPEHWERPGTFDPDHFLPEKVEKRPKFVYMPFGGGQRLCMGDRLAMMMSSIILSMAAQRYRVTLAPGAKVERVMGGVFYPDGLQMIIQRADRPSRAS
jgi:cytochrome P450